VELLDITPGIVGRYAEVDLEMKAKALANCEVKTDQPQKPWRYDKGLMEFLRTL
jgi:integrase/recombinase XerD